MNNFTTTMQDISTAFTIGSLEIKWYGIFITVGFVLAIILACVKLEKWYKISCNPFYWFVFIGIPVSLLGARIWSFIIGDASKSLATQNFFAAFFNFREGGLAIEGGVLLTVIAALIYFPLVLKKPQYNVKTKIGNEYYVKQVSMWVYADAIVPCILVGQIIGRWGNFFNQEVYGPIATEAELAWLKTLMPGVYNNMFITTTGNLHHPFFLYESFINFWFFLAIYIGGEFIKKRKAGDLAIAYFICYGLLRSCMEPFRYSDYQFATSIVMSVLFALFGIILLVCNHLVFSKHRDFKFWEFIIYKTKKFFKQDIKEFLDSKRNADNLKVQKQINKNITKEPNFYRKPSEIFYYNGY
ncbi:prolipoprotein diacylglyceryl transferase [Malacoplasma penetrans]|nr:prolipoprotein diacylglyceryl transferase [Malacoplasma penetrans]